MLKQDAHKRAMDRLESLVDLDHLAAVDRLHDDMWAGRPLPHLPCIVGFDFDSGWPNYPLPQCWDDLEKNFMAALWSVHDGAALKDDRLFQVRAEYGVVNLPETFGIPSIVTDQGRSMSEGLRDEKAIRDLIARGVPDFQDQHTKKVLAFYDYARDVLKNYPKLAKAVAFTLPDTQGPFDLACLVWNPNEILVALYEEPELVHSLLGLMTDAYIRYNTMLQDRLGLPRDTAVHICGLKLVKGGIRICDDSATLAGADMYREFILPYNRKAFRPFSGGWLHYCGQGTHLLDAMLSMEDVRALHLGNPDYHDFLDVAARCAKAETVLYWSGALDRLPDAWQTMGKTRLLALVENRYAAKDWDDAKARLATVRAGKPIAKAAW